MRIYIKMIVIFCAVQSILFGDELNTVYLASFPRSGNHWVRFMVEEATHVATSSVFRDMEFPHLMEIFPWGGYCTDHGYNGLCRYPTKDDPILLKTHYPYIPNKMSQDIKHAICLIRHPIDVFWSYYRYRGGAEDGKISETKLAEYINSWVNFYEFWQSQPDVLFIRYEDLQENTAVYLSSILQKAGYVFDETDIERAVTKFPPEGMPLKHIDCYDAEAIDTIKEKLSHILTEFNYDL